MALEQVHFDIVALRCTRFDVEPAASRSYNAKDTGKDELLAVRSTLVGTARTLGRARKEGLTVFAHHRSFNGRATGSRRQRPIGTDG